jgi:acyl-CoA dehydrogenase
MSEESTLIAKTAKQLFTSADDADFARQWRAVEDSGLPLLLVSEDRGGSQGHWSDLFAVQWEAGRAATWLPVGEAIIAHWLAEQAGIKPPSGFGTFFVTDFGDTLRDVPHGAQAAWVIGRNVKGSTVLAERPPLLFTAENVAGEPRDTLSTAHDSKTLNSGTINRDLMALAALMRLGQICGAVSGVVELTSNYVQTRHQFGKPLSGFQAVQQNLAELITEAAATQCAARAATHVSDRTGPYQAWYAIGAAKLRANMAIGLTTSLAHQLHGAIGFTQDYALHSYTRRLWSWRTEAGNDRYWSEVLGRYAADRGAANAWADLVSL